MEKVTAAVSRKDAQTLFAAWIAENHPQLFNQLARAIGAEQKDMLVSGFTDVLTSIGSAIGSAASKIASGVGTTVQAVGGFLGTAGGQNLLQAYVATKLAPTQQQVFQTQNALAQAGQTPAPIQTRYDPQTGQYVPVLTTGGQSYPINASVLNSLQPDVFQRYGPWLLAGGAVLAFLLFMKR